MQSFQRVYKFILDVTRKFFRVWFEDIRRRRSCTGKGLSFIFGFFIILLVCSLPFMLINSIGIAIGVIPTITPTRVSQIIETPTIIASIDRENTNTIISPTTIPPTKTPVIEAVDPCSLKVEQIGRSEPKYVGLKGFLKASPNLEDYDQNLPKYPWSVPIFTQVGPNLWEPGSDKLLAKTPVRVIEQHLTHQRYGIYRGFLIVQSLENSQNYVVDHYSFVPTDYWNCPPHIAVKYGPFIAKIKDGIRPVDRDGRWEDVGEIREVYCTGLPSIEDADLVHNGVECLMYKEYRYGFGGVRFIFPSDGLEIIY